MSITFIVLSIVIYVVYSIGWVMIFMYYDIPDNYIGWIKRFPNKRRRMVLYIISGSFSHIVIGCSFIAYKFSNTNISKSLFSWFEE